MDNVRPISEFLNNPKLVEKTALESDEPIYFEGEGSNDIVVTNREAINAALFNAIHIAIAEKSSEECEQTGECYSTEETKELVLKAVNERIQNKVAKKHS